ncbi:MAG: hypothetical protein D6683_17145 [Actinomyces sp.]|nr:MAG: hypothetical protein D6683_17145 [Actinomyces sp.]
MYVEVGSAAEGVVLAEADDFTAFAVRVTAAAASLSSVELAARIGDAVAVDDDHVAIAPERLRALAGRADDPSWRDGFDAMCAYAASAGWVDGAGRIRAHLERP